MEQQRKLNTEAKHKQYTGEIKRLTMEGETQNQIAEELDISRRYVASLIKASKENGTWFTKEELQEFRRQNSPKINHIKEIKRLTGEGKKRKQIAKKLGFSVSYIASLIKESKDSGTWDTNEQ